MRRSYVVARGAEGGSYLSFPSESAAEHYIERQVARAERIAATGSDYGACRLANAQQLIVVTTIDGKPPTGPCGKDSVFRHLSMMPE